MKNDELDDLRAAWNAAAGEQKDLSREELALLVRRRARSAYAGIRRNLLLEAVVGSLAMLAWAYFVSRIAAGNGEAYLAALQMTLLTVLPLFFFYYAGFRRLGRGVAPEAGMASSLRRTIAYWDQALQLYFWGGAAMIPSFLLSSVWFVNSLGGSYLLKITEHMSWARIVAWIAGISAVTIFFVWVSIQAGYAKHVRHLKACLRELEENGE
ncbi:MAG: hypothetical protein KDC70_19410 [Saprospiraceae bacterium]|nr:hypothetical protein [Saprospiraceae bacterium]